MDPSWMEDVLDSIKNYEVQTKQLFEQQETLVQQRLKEITSNQPPAKRRKASKHCSGADGKENIFTAGTAQKQQGNCTKTNSSRRQMKRVADSNSWERILNPNSVTHSEELDERRPETEMIISQQETSDYQACGDGGQLNEVELSSVAISLASDSLEKKTSLSAPKLVPRGGRKRGCVTKAGALSFATDACESLDIVPGVERLQKAIDDPESPRSLAAPVPVRMTRARAKLLENCDGSSVDAQLTKTVKNPRGQKGRVKAVPQAISVSEVDESIVKIVPDVQAVDENVTRIEQIPDVNDSQSVGADDVRNEHMNQDQDVGPALAFREQSVKNPRAQKGRSKAISKSTTKISEEEKRFRGVANLRSLEEKQLGREADQADAERQSGGADDLWNRHIKNLVRDDGITGITQEEQLIKKPSPQQGCAEAALKTNSRYEEANVVPHVPLVVGGDLRIQSTQEDGERQSGKADVSRDDQEHMEDVAKGGTHTIIAQEEELVKKPRAKRGRHKASLTYKTAISEEENRVRGLDNLQSLDGKQFGHEPNQADAERESAGAEGLRNRHTKNLVRDDGTTVSAQEEQPVKKSSSLQFNVEVALETNSICEEAKVPLGVAQLPLLFGRDSRIGSTQEDDERQSEKVVREDHTEDVVNGGTHLAFSQEEVVKKPRAKKGRAKAVSKATISSRQKVNVAPCSDAMQLAREKDPSTELMHAKGYRHYGVADDVIDKEMKDVVNGADYTVVAKPGSKSTLPYEVEENTDDAITSARCIEAEDVRNVESKANGQIHRERAHDARVEAVIEIEKEVGIVTVQEAQAFFETDGQLKRSGRGRRQKGSAEAVSSASLSNVGLVIESLLDVQSAGEEDVGTQSWKELDDQHNGGVEDACIEPTREDEDDLSSAELDSERWEDIKRSVKVRKGRGKAVSNFLGYADPDLFPLRSFDMALEQDRNETPAEDLKGFMQTARPFSDLLRRLDAAAFASTQKNLQTELELGGGRKDGSTDGRQSGASRGEVFMPRKLNISEEVSADVVKERGTSDVTDEPPMRSGKKLVARVPVVGSVLQQVSGDIGGRASVTPKAVSQGPGPISESLERSAGAVVSGRGFRHLVKELKLELESTEPRRLDPEFVIDLFPADKSVNARKTLQENSRPESVLHRERSNDGNQAEQAGVSTEWTVEVTGGRKLVLEGDDSFHSHNKQGVQMFANVQEMARDSCTALEALEPDLVSEIEKFPFVALEQVRSKTEYQRRDASPNQETWLTGIKLRIRPFSEFCDAEASSQKRGRSVLTSTEGGEARKSDCNYGMVLLEHEEPSTLESSKSRNFSLVASTLTRGKGEASNPAKEVVSGNCMSTDMKSTTSRVQMATGGEFDSLKDIFTLKTPLRSQKRNVNAALAECQSMGQEVSPPFHVRDAGRSRRSASVNNRPSHSHRLRSSSRVEDHEVGGLGVKTHSAAKSTRPTEEESTRGGLPGGGLQYMSTKILITSKTTDFLAQEHLHHNVSSPVRVDFPTESGSKKSLCEDQYRSGRYGSFTPGSSHRSGKLGDPSKVVTISPSPLGQESQPRDVVNFGVDPLQHLRDCSGDTVVLSDDDQDTLTSRLKSLGSSRQAGKCERPVRSPSFSKMLLSTPTLEDLNPRNGSLRYEVHRAESKLAADETGKLSDVKISQHLECEIRPGGTEVEGYKVAVSGPKSIKSACGPGGFEDRFEKSKRVLQSPPCSEPKRSRFSTADVSGKECGSAPVDSDLGPRVNLPEDADEVTATQSFHQAGADVHSGSTVYVSDEDEGFGSESSGDTSIESRGLSKFKSSQGDGDQDNSMEGPRELDNEYLPVGNEVANEENALEEGTELTDSEECSDDNEAGTEEVDGPMKSSKQWFNSVCRKSTSRKRKEQEDPGECCDYYQHDQHRHEADAHNVPGSFSYEEKGAYSTHFEDGPSRRTKARRTVELLDTASCPVEEYVGYSDIRNVQCKSNYGECGIADSITATSSFGKTCIEEPSTAKVAQSSERPRTNSNIVNPHTQSTRLLSNVRTLIPVSQRPAPTFIPNGKRDVKVKALEAAEAARRLQEKREVEKRERMLKRADVIAKRAMEKEKLKEESHKAEQESRASQKAVSDSNTAKDLSALAGKAVLTDCTNSKSLQSPKSKSTRALALKTKIEQEKAKKLEEELKKKEEERKKKEAEVLARKRRKEEAEKKEREEKRRRQEEMLKQRKEQEERLRAELEEKEHRHRVLEEAERERKALEEESRRQRRAEREKERERRQKEELEAKAARQAEKEAERKRKEEAFIIYKASEEHDHRVGESMGAASTAPRVRSQHSTGLSNDKLRGSNLLSTGASLSFSRAARVPSTAFEGRTHMMATPIVQNKGPTNSLSAIKMQSLGTAGKNLEMDHCSKPSATPTLAAVEHGDPGPQSYEISPYRESSDEEDEETRPKKFIPAWASKENLMPQLLRQLTQDPDEIFAGTKTCSLKEVFGTSGSKKVLDFGRRSGSGDWVKDRVSWKEELQYKIDMGYMSHIH